ncbi:hypothetical protein PsorP6_009789 [Peronosclerospora sorghi]|uniref:Uncharacterized protein n=1 Tax=Peronosclerospora sorghi TaxID=230839 RepID=A0ACC0VXV1_9STRA|nr:hypothetical protein PsorP6_009789 [Peronosclerospora sorghi]
MPQKPPPRSDEFPPLDHRGKNPVPYPDQRLYPTDGTTCVAAIGARVGSSTTCDSVDGVALALHVGAADWDAGPRVDDARATRVSYKVWMMRQTNESSPKVYTQRYEEYQKKHVQRVLRAFLEQHKRDEWLQERYSPALRARVEKQKRTHQMKQSQAM